MHAAGKADLGKVAIGEGTLFRHRLHGGAGITNARQLSIDLGIGQFGGRLLHLHVLIAVDGELRKHFEGGFEAQRLALLEIDFGHLRLRDGLEVPLGDGGAEVFRQNGFHHVLANLLGEAAADQRLRNFARTEARDARHFFDIVW